MATSEFHGDDVDNNMECTKEWPLTYVRDTKEYICGCCGQVFAANHMTQDLEAHFKSCKNSKDNGSSMNFKDLRKMNQKMERLCDDVRVKVDKMKAEVIEEVRAKILHVKSQLVDKTMTGFHQEPSPFDQSTISMSVFNLITHNYLFRPSFRWTVDGIDTFLALNTFELTSELFQWKGYPVQARAKLQLKEDGSVYLSLSLKEVANLENLLKVFLPIPRVFYLLKDQRVKNSDHKCLGARYLFSSTFNCSLKFENSLCHKSWFSYSKYNANNSIEIEIYVEPSSMSQLVHSNNGTLEWAIENYKKRLHAEKSKLVYFQESPYFYTGPSGYRVQVVLYLNGRGEKGPTAYVMFLTGKYDADLPKSFSHSTTVTLVNCKDAEKSITKTIVKNIEKEKQYEIEMCKFEEVQDLVENDTLFCKMVVIAH